MPKIGLLVRIESKAEYADRGWLVRGQSSRARRGSLDETDTAFEIYSYEDPRARSSRARGLAGSEETSDA
jgi:hypothetical protein